MIDQVDAEWAPAVEAAGMACVVTGTVMDTPKRSLRLAEVVLGV